MFDRNAAIAIPSMPVCGLTGGVGSHGLECVGMPLQPSVTDFHSVGAEPDPLLGRVINDRYRIIEQIGHGGMGRVYKALQAPLDRLVALKILAAGHDRDPNFYKRFFLEASVTAKLTHPNTITLYDYGRTEDGIFFIAMEYLDGRTLSEAMQQDGALAQERAIHVAQQICRSLREAHALGIVHRDLKPANIMLLRQHDDHDFLKVQRQQLAGGSLPFPQTPDALKKVPPRALSAPQTAPAAFVGTPAAAPPPPREVVVRPPPPPLDALEEATPREALVQGTPSLVFFRLRAALRSVRPLWIGIGASVLAAVALTIL